MAWVETRSPSFEARHDAADADAVRGVLERLEEFRADLEKTFKRMPSEVVVVIHSSPLMLTVAHPWLELARLAASPASRRYFGGWFTRDEIHVLSPKLLEERASKVQGSAQALRLSPLHEYAHLVIGANNPQLPPPFNPRSFRNYLRWAWLCEGAATWMAGQTPYLAPAITARLRDGSRPAFPPAPRDAMLLGGSVFDLLERGSGPDACVQLMSRLDPKGPEAALERAFARQLGEVRRDWIASLEDLTATPSTTELERRLPLDREAAVPDFAEGDEWLEAADDTLGGGVPDDLVPRTPIDPDDISGRRR
jgi:hypothetical protein